jgi:hypothetical protein
LHIGHMVSYTHEDRPIDVRYWGWIPTLGWSYRSELRIAAGDWGFGSFGHIGWMSCDVTLIERAVAIRWSTTSQLL